MVSEIKDLNRTFSDIEIDLINEFTERHQGVKTISDLGFIVVESDSIDVSFKVKRYEEGRQIKVCIRKFGDYNCHTANNPSDLKKHLGL